MCSPSFLSVLANLVNITVVDDAQARITGCIVVETTELEEQMGADTLPPRVHFYCPDYDHMNIAKPSNLDHPNYRLTKTYVANWLQHPTTVKKHTERINWDDFARSIVDTVRMYALVIERIADTNTIIVLTNVSGALASVLRTMSINEFLILLAFVYGTLIATAAGGIGAGAVIGGPIGIAVGASGVIAATSTGAILVSRLAPRVRTLLTDNSAAIREMVNLISAYVMPDFEDIISGAQSDQELDATLNYLRRTAAQAICCVFLEPEQPTTIMRDPNAIRSAVERHDQRILQAERVVDRLSLTMNGIITINSDEAEQAGRTILTRAFIEEALHGTATNIH